MTHKGIGFLSTFDLHHLDLAVRPIYRAFGQHPYIVGSANERPDFRDVDIRLMLPDAEFDALFGERKKLWGLLCYSITAWLRAETGLPIDFQIQRTTEANARFGGKMRNPLGVDRDFAGLGDANNLDPVRNAQLVAAPHPEAEGGRT